MMIHLEFDKAVLLKTTNVMFLDDSQSVKRVLWTFFDDNFVNDSTTILKCSWNLGLWRDLSIIVLFREMVYLISLYKRQAKPSNKEVAPNLSLKCHFLAFSGSELKQYTCTIHVILY